MNKFASLTAAITNLRNATNYFDLTNILLRDIGAEKFSTERPIQLTDITKNRKPTQYVSLANGVREIAKIAGTEVVRGVPNKLSDWSDFISTEYDGLIFYQIEERDDENTKTDKG